VHPARGKFRSFLLACLNNYVGDERDKQLAQKRGGGIEIISMDVSDTEQRYGVNPTDAWDPAKLFEQRWARVLLTQVLIRLKERCASNGKTWKRRLKMDPLGVTDVTGRGLRRQHLQRTLKDVCHYGRVERDSAAGTG
jgi:hypothetical protein